MKLTSISDVITNSSSEVFLILGSTKLDPQVVMDIDPQEIEALRVTEKNIHEYRIGDLEESQLEDIFEYNFADFENFNGTARDIYLQYLLFPKQQEPVDVISSDGSLRRDYIDESNLSKEFFALKAEFQKRVSKAIKYDIKIHHNNQYYQKREGMSLEQLYKDSSFFRDEFAVGLKEFLKEYKADFPDSMVLNRIYGPYPLIESAIGCVWGSYESGPIDTDYFTDELEKLGYDQVFIEYP